MKNQSQELSVAVTSSLFERLLVRFPHVLSVGVLAAGAVLAFVIRSLG